ncbi:DUF4169 family protein [Tropicibacter naphthalenivorans]|nr:DUF4169 family protein [Tropicibacter naphthalenivorans]
MSNVVNLNKFRKQKAKGDRRQQADENAVKHGRTKAERDLDKARDAKAKRDLDGHERE